MEGVGRALPCRPWARGAGRAELGAGGLHFIGAATDRYFRAFDTDTGEVVWKTRLTYGAHATPMSYRLTPESKQFVVVSAGGNVLTEIGDALVAFSLSD